MADSSTTVHPQAVAAFLVRCSNTHRRFFYPCNAKHRPPRRQVYCLRSSTAAEAVRFTVEECDYAEGGTGWRVWPCALLLACWLANHVRTLVRPDASVLELGCGLGLPGLAAAALGYRNIVLTDCLPELLATVERSIRVNPASSTLRVELCDWDHEAHAPEGEDYSTEQGVKQEQLKRLGATMSTRRLSRGERFALLLASDVIYSHTHAVQLPAVLARHAAPAARLCAMVPVRDQEHTRTFLRGLLHSRAEVRTATVTPRWVEAVVAVQQGKAPVQSMRATAPFRADDAIKEGSILFVEATFPIDPSVSILEPPPSLRSEPAAADPCIDDDDEGFLMVN